MRGLTIFTAVLLAVEAVSCGTYAYRYQPTVGDVQVRTDEKKEVVYHKVKKGETLWRISKKYDVPLEELAKVNNIKDVTQIKEGQTLIIPRPSRNVSDASIPEENSVEKNVSSDFNEFEHPDFIWPAQGPVVSGFGLRGKHFHKGIDIDGRVGDPIYAAADGEVAFSGWMRGYGNVIIIKHANDFSTVYAHNQINLVHQGDRVRKGQLIARMGRTGNAQGSHLHFEIRYRGKAVNPITYLPPRP